MSQNPEVKLPRNTELAFTEAHLTDLNHESCIYYIALFFVFCWETAELLVTVHFIVPFLPVILILVYFCLKVDEESDLHFFMQTSVNCYYSELCP